MNRFFIISIGLIAFFFVILVIFNFLNKYQSAFEADQKCHSEKISKYSNNSLVDCDHDLETRQWILFESSQSNDPAIVLERFRY